jgi:hypothetical protein
MGRPLLLNKTNNMTFRNGYWWDVNVLLGKSFPVWEALCSRLNPPGGSGVNLSRRDSFPMKK